MNEDSKTLLKLTRTGQLSNNLFKKLVPFGKANIDCYDWFGKTPLMIATKGSVACFNILLAGGADVMR